MKRRKPNDKLYSRPRSGWYDKLARDLGLYTMTMVAEELGIRTDTLRRIVSMEGAPGPTESMYISPIQTVRLFSPEDLHLLRLWQESRANRRHIHIKRRNLVPRSQRRVYGEPFYRQRTNTNPYNELPAVPIHGRETAPQIMRKLKENAVSSRGEDRSDESS